MKQKIKINMPHDMPHIAFIIIRTIINICTLVHTAFTTLLEASSGHVLELTGTLVCTRVAMTWHNGETFTTMLQQRKQTAAFSTSLGEPTGLS
jgi:hypothetical protein